MAGLRKEIVRRGWSFLPYTDYASQVLELMTNNHIRHLTALGGNTLWSSLVSIGDVVKAIITHHGCHQELWKAISRVRY